jgi:hypothetical protein
MEFAAPAAGSVLKPAEVEGHLLVVEPVEYIERMSTQMGDSDAVRCTVHDITAGTTHTEVLWFSTVLVGSLRTRIGAKVLGMMAKGVAKPGQTAPWVLQDASGEPAAVQAAKDYLSKAASETPPVDELAAALNKLGAKLIDTPF